MVLNILSRSAQEETPKTDEDGYVGYEGYVQAMIDCVVDEGLAQKHVDHIRDKNRQRVIRTSAYEQSTVNHFLHDSRQDYAGVVPYEWPGE